MLYTLNQPWTLIPIKASGLVLLTLHIYSLLDALYILTYFDPIIG